MKTLRAYCQGVQDVLRGTLLLALAFALLSPLALLPCHGQTPQDSDAWTVDQPPPDSAPPNSPPQPPPVPAHLDIYGFAMLDNGYNAGQIDPNWFDVMRPTKLPAFKDEFGKNGVWFAGVRQTRLGFRSYIPTAEHPIKIVVDFDFFGVGVDAGQTTIRLRHAYGEYGKFLAGQTESTFMDLDVFPNILDYWGPNGMVFFRNVQLRWTPWSTKYSNAMFSVERPGASSDGGIYADRIELQNIRPRFRYPDVAGHVRLGNKRGHIQLAGIVRDIKWDDVLPNDPFNLDGGVVGWGVHVSSNININKDVVRLSAVYGNGIENYMNDAPLDVGVVNNLSNHVTPILGTALPVLGIVSFLDHAWSDKFTSSIGYSMVKITNSDGQLPSDFKRGQYGILNLLYNPVKPVLMGGEFQWGRRSNFSDGYRYNDYKIQVSFKYSFSFTLERH
jgi:DcaP outer membrane protein